MAVSRGTVSALALACALAALLFRGVEGAFGSAKVTESFDSAFSASFLSGSVSKKSYCLRKSKKQNKPLMVIMTRTGCGACQNLKQSVNMAPLVRLLPPPPATPSCCILVQTSATLSPPLPRPTTAPDNTQNVYRVMTT